MTWDLDFLMGNLPAEVTDKKRKHSATTTSLSIITDFNSITSGSNKNTNGETKIFLCTSRALMLGLLHPRQLLI